jgi:alpha-tubulin suppressor-like RCC1 family protein
MTRARHEVVTLSLLAPVAATALAVVACREPAPAPVPRAQPIVAPIGSASSSALHVAVPPPEAPRERPFELIAGWQLCARVNDALHCPDKIEPDKPLSAAPAAIDGVAVASASFGRDFGCVVTRSGAVQCFGGNHFGQLGARVREEKHDAPLTLPNVAGAKRVVSGPFHTCAILENGKVSCWGKNQFGENGSATQYLEAARELVEPEIVNGVEGVTELALSWDATCAVTRKKEMWCWGRSKTDEQRAARGDSNEGAASVDALAGITSVVANESSMCGVRDGAVVCWGDTMMLGGSPRGGLHTLVVPGAKRVSLGANHGCALTASGDVYCFGSNMNGELGVEIRQGDYMPHAPAKVEGVADAIDVVCGSAVSCAVTAHDDVLCWGRFSWQEADGANPSPRKIRVF